MPRHHNNEDDDTLRDGERLRTPLHLMDSMQRDVRATLGPLHFDDVLDQHKPGFRRHLADNTADPRIAAYEAVEYADSTAWQRPPGRDADDPVTGSGEVPFIGTRVGDVCMTDSKQSGHMKMIDGMMQCVADPVSNKQGMDGLSATEKAYRLADWEAENAWRNPR